MPPYFYSHTVNREAILSHDVHIEAALKNRFEITQAMGNTRIPTTTNW